jgi:hypothetical protein
MFLEWREAPVHRVFVVRDPADTDPIGVLSLCDVLALFAVPQVGA